MSQTISILGAGNVGMALATALTRAGDAVVVGVPDRDKYRDQFAAQLPSVRLLGTDAAITAGDVIILAVPYSALGTIAAMRTDWHSKILVDATNPLAPGLSGLSLGTHTSGAETLAAMASGARVVKAFNTTGAENLADSRYPGGVPFMPVCGDDAAAKQHVMALATRIGFDAVDAGSLAAARYLEPFAMTWIHLAIKMGHGRSFAFSRLQRA
ncbi:dinucleotide-binding enzyme [Ahniella affigens]|uniref:Dinucleotide-binding enzyme n=1 Tax=Ahniella affigens TaxID=2021234 RepID=A0A2P1PQB8_9GAMM|nr:NADPH-dependent F420 reductase [Ahniella affigens]AVP97030.1 dinucleotide-binding enzyme [Ahniella affigens]